MLVRVIFSVVVTLGLLVGAAFWHADERPPTMERAGEALDPVMERAGEALEPVVERALELADETAERIEEAAPAVVPVVKETAAAVVAAARPPEPTPVAAPAPEPAEPEVVEEEEISQSWDEPFVEGPSDDQTEGGEILTAQIPGPVPSWTEGAPADQDEWAGLIRRMLAIRGRVEAAR